MNHNAEPLQQQHLPQIVLITDRNLLGATLFTLSGILHHISGKGSVHFWGNGLHEADWINVKRIAAINSAITLYCHNLSASDFEHAKKPLEHISVTAMGRLFIPSRLTGRVLYIDGDTHVVGDVTPLFSLDLEGQPIAAIRDYLTTKWAVYDYKKQKKRPKRITQIQEMLENYDISNYVNSGVLLLDTDAIRSEPETLEKMQDVALASSYPMGDQDHLNKIFYERIYLLNPSYNSTWGRAKKQRKLIKTLTSCEQETKPQADTIIHFIGPDKPWKAPRYDLWKRRSRAVFRYRRELEKFLHDFQDITI